MVEAVVDIVETKTNFCNVYIVHFPAQWWERKLTRCSTFRHQAQSTFEVYWSQDILWDDVILQVSHLRSRCSVLNLLQLEKRMGVFPFMTFWMLALFGLVTILQLTSLKIDIYPPLYNKLFVSGAGHCMNQLRLVFSGVVCGCPPDGSLDMFPILHRHRFF